MIHAERTIVAPTERGTDVIMTFTEPGTQQSCAAVLVLHGFKGFRNWGFFPFAAQHFADCGFLSCRMDFSMNGMRGGNDRVQSPEEFADNTVSAEISEASSVAQAFGQHLAIAGLAGQWNGTLHIVGHSRGGGVAHHVGALLPETTKVVAWNSIGSWIRWSARQREAWLRTGYVEVENSRTQQTLRMNSAYLRDIEEHNLQQGLLDATEQLGSRLFHIHAQADLTVPLKEIQALRQAARTSASIEMLQGTTHTFGITHPVEHITPAFAKALSLTTDFLLR